MDGVGGVEPKTDQSRRNERWVRGRIWWASALIVRLSTMRHVSHERTGRVLRRVSDQSHNTATHPKYR
jgi:hypothetical protein